MTQRLTRLAFPAMFGFRLAVACGVLFAAVIVVVLMLVVSGVIE